MTTSAKGPALESPDAAALGIKPTAQQLAIRTEPVRAIDMELGLGWFDGDWSPEDEKNVRSDWREVIRSRGDKDQIRYYGGGIGWAAWDNGFVPARLPRSDTYLDELVSPFWSHLKRKWEPARLLDINAKPSRAKLCHEASRILGYWVEDRYWNRKLLPRGNKRISRITKLLKRLRHTSVTRAQVAELVYLVEDEEQRRSRLRPWDDEVRTKARWFLQLINRITGEPNSCEVIAHLCAGIIPYEKVLPVVRAEADHIAAERGGRTRARRPAHLTQGGEFLLMELCRAYNVPTGRRHPSDFEHAIGESIVRPGRRFARPEDYPWPKIRAAGAKWAESSSARYKGGKTGGRGRGDPTARDFEFWQIRKRRADLFPPIVRLKPYVIAEILKRPRHTDCQRCRFQTSHDCAHCKTCKGVAKVEGYPKATGKWVANRWKRFSADPDLSRRLEQQGPTRKAGTGRGESMVGAAEHS